MTKERGVEAQREALQLSDWSFISVLESINKLALRGNVDLSDPRFLRETVYVKEWEVLDELGRDPKHLSKLTPPLGLIEQKAEKFGVSKEARDRLFANAVGGQSLANESLGSVGYAWLSERQIASQLIYAFATQIQGDPDTLGVDERDAQAEAFLDEFYGYGWNSPDEDLQKEVEYYETQLGVLFCLRALAVMNEHELDLTELARQGFMKYGVKDTRGRRVCYWCRRPACACGGRKAGMKADRPEITREVAQTHGLPEMDRHMAVYGVGRNSAINTLAGIVRSLSEHGGEYGYVNLISRHGGERSAVEARLGCLNQTGTRYPRMRNKSEAKGVPLSEDIYSEAADAVISWPCLVTQAMGLNFVRSVKRGLEHMAKYSGVEISFPEDRARVSPYQDNVLPLIVREG